MTRALLLVSLIACAPDREPEAWDDWFGAMGPLDEDVLEPVLFTDQPYTDLPASDRLGSLGPLFQNFTRKYAPADVPLAGCSGWSTDSALPKQVWGTVTVLPRYYFKTTGCDTQADPGDSEEKFYGNFWLQDDTRGLFVLNDSKVAHFDAGDRVLMQIRGVGRRFDLDMVVAHDIVEVQRGPFPIYYKMAEPLAFGGTYPDEAIGEVRRVEGVVDSWPDTFGEFFVVADDGSRYAVALDSELNRRGVGFAPGRRIRATGPVQRAFGDKIIVLRIGQLEPLN